MILKLKKGKQKEIINKAIIKAGSERKLCKLINLPKGSLYRYKFEIDNLPRNRLLKIINFLDLNFIELKKNILNKLPNNWGKIKGGVNCVKKKKAKGTFENEIIKLKILSSTRMKEWHHYMKNNFPKKYYNTQYERFKKINGGYTHKLINGILVRNKLEKEVGDFLVLNGFDFEYEPYINVHGKAYFPDFKIGNTIIEATQWTNPNKDKINKINTKINNYNLIGLKTILFIPEPVRKFYKEIEIFIISDLKDLKDSLNASVAQTY